MDGIWQLLNGVTTFALVIALISLVVLYLVIRLAVMHALRDHERWVEKKRIKDTRTTYPQHAFPPISPDSNKPF